MENRGCLENFKIRRLSLRLTKYAEIAEGDVGANGASHNHADQDHDLLPGDQRLGQSCLGLDKERPEEGDAKNSTNWKLRITCRIL